MAAGIGCSQRSKGRKQRGRSETGDYLSHTSALCISARRSQKRGWPMTMGECNAFIKGERIFQSFSVMMLLDFERESEGFLSMDKCHILWWSTILMNPSSPKPSQDEIVPVAVAYARARYRGPYQTSSTRDANNASHMLTTTRIEANLH